MAEPRTKENRELSLGDDFGPAVFRFNGLTVSTDGNRRVTLETGSVTVYIDIANGNTTVYGGNVTAHTGAPAIITSRLDVRSFSPDNRIIRAGTVQLNKISRYLADLPDTATATLLVSPEDLANIDRGGLGTWVNSVKRIRGIKGYHGLDGMEIYDRPETARGTTYEKAWADQIKAAFALAQFSGKEVTTGLFMPTKQLVHGREIGSRDVTVNTNLYSRRNEIGTQGDAFITESGSGGARLYCSATENPDFPFSVYDVDFTDGDDYWDPKDDLELSSRLVALVLQP